MPRATRTIFRAAGGLMLAGGLCIFGVTTLCASASPQTKPKTSASSKKTTVKKPASKSSKKKGSRSARSHMQTVPTPDRIIEIQSALAKAGAYQGDPTGKWDANTTDAMKRFQVSNGLQPTGKLGALSLQKLGLGSATAGRGAPKLALPNVTTSSPTSPRLP